MKILYRITLMLTTAFALTACMSEPGSKAWCDKLKEQTKAQWTVEDAGTFTQYCVLGNYKK
ncbi:MAG: DUF3012 domain-containing protein [Mariprofundus sp.]|nr:DUF3012 domain-containing protein [Mariprofundus sp.]